MSRSGRVGLSLVLAAFFFAWHWPLLTDAGRVRGFNSDAAIIALMGKKIFDGRGFDIFFWGQNYVGPLTSIAIAAAGALVGEVGPLALRVGTFALVLAGILLVGSAIWRIEPRAAVVTMIALAITPPVILRMMITPLGAEMAFVMAAALLALLLADRPRPLAIGLVAGIGWWMNQQIVFTLLAAAAVFGWRSAYVRAAVAGLRPLERWRFRTAPLPGWLHALLWLLTRVGLLLLLAFIVSDLAEIDVVPFVFGRVTDPLLLIVVPLALVPTVAGEWRLWRLPPRTELAIVLRFAVGFAIGYAPVWLGRVFRWYERSYVFAFSFNDPSEVVAQFRAFGDVFAHWIGLAPGIAGVSYTIAFSVFAAVGLWNARTEKRRMVALVPLFNVVFYLLASGAKPHYLIASVGMLFALASLGALDLWNRRRAAVRALVCAGGVAAAASLALAAQAMRGNVLREPDPLILLRQVEAAQCRVVYADFWVAYRYRLLDLERRAWIPYRSQNRTRAESFAMQKLPGQRCLIDAGAVTMIAHDLPIVHATRR